MVPFYKTVFFESFMIIYFVLGISTAIACYITSKKNNTGKVTLWTVLGYFIPVIPFLYLKTKLRNS